MKTLLFCCVCMSFLFAFSSCKKSTRGGADSKTFMPRKVSPRDIDLAGIKLYLTSAEVKRQLPALRCGKKDGDMVVCNWKTTEADRQRIFRGIDQIRLTFYRDTAQTIRVQYSQMFDVEYTNFEQAVREKYAYALGDRITDTIGTEWRYDSLGITLIPNRKQHWTGSVFTYSPELEFQELYLYKRWLEALGKEKLKTIY